MPKAKHRGTSVLLTLCLTVVMLAGSIIAMPVTVKADCEGIESIDIAYDSSGEPAVRFNFKADSGGGCGWGVRAGSTIVISAGTSSWEFGMGYAPYSANNLSFTVIHQVSFDGQTPGTSTFKYDYNPAVTYTITIPAGTFFDGSDQPLSWNVNAVSFTIPGTPSAPTQAPDYGTDEHFQRHYDYWLPVVTQLNELGNTGTVTVDTTGQNIDHIMSCVFGKLENTNRTLIVKHEGRTYTIKGGPDKNGYMGKIWLGNNHSFALLLQLGYGK